jgi:serine/threonine protein phosphatase 1
MSNRVVRYGRNTKGKDYITGDVHGTFTRLKEQLDVLLFDYQSDRLFCVGDLVDKGEESHLFLNWLNYPWFHSVRGNHDQLLIGNYNNDINSYHCHMRNGGQWFEDISLVDSDTRTAMYEACLALPYIIEVETADGFVGVLHADTGRSNDWQDFVSAVEAGDPAALETCLWSRHGITAYNSLKHYSDGDITFDNIDGIHKVYVGHTPVDSILEIGNVVYIDTGACFGRDFTIVEI